MLGEVSLYSRIYLAYGYTDLRFGIDGLARVVQDHFELDPFQKGALFLFCGRGAGVLTGSRDCCGKGMGFCLSINGWKRDVSGGPGQRPRRGRSRRSSLHG